jgi:hypothetical protein
LQVVLSRPEARQYSLQVTAESVLPPFPADVELPVIEPKGGIRNGGALAVGTNSAVQLRIKQTGGLSQVDATAFPRLTSTPEQPRPLPQAKLFAYTFASTPYQMALGLDDIVPAFDAEVRLGLELREDDLVADTEVELDIRDAPIRQVTVAVPARFVVASVAGQEVDDHTVREGAPPGAAQEVEVHFRQPVLGRTLIKLRLELGKSPLDTLQAVAGFAVPSAKSVRGYVTLALDRGMQADAPTVEGLRQVHTSSVPGTDERVQSAYRFGPSASRRRAGRPASGSRPCIWSPSAKAFCTAASR